MRYNLLRMIERGVAPLPDAFEVGQHGTGVWIALCLFLCERPVEQRLQRIRLCHPVAKVHEPRNWITHVSGQKLQPGFAFEFIVVCSRKGDASKNPTTIGREGGRPHV
jgi:hypothetical protein